MFGNCKLRDYSLVEKVGTGVQLVNTLDAELTVGDLVNVVREKRGTKQPRPNKPLDVIGMDIRYSDGI